ncbi:MAG: 50S ribosomal protein L9 [Holosporaceae bacterium]|jgi:large subunit ribosomal protein L9|nr:50S ribosomal protein L9 [Holosporaceae bacterium]
MESLKVILLRKVAGLGAIGDIVGVKPGFARNYLLPKKIAMRATVENIEQFKACRTQIEEHNAKTRTEAEKVAEKINGVVVVLVRQSSEKGHLYGSVTARDIAAAVGGAGFNITAGQINLNNPIKLLGIYEVAIDLHPEVSAHIRLSVAKSEEEAHQQIAELESKDQEKTTEAEAPAEETNYENSFVEDENSQKSVAASVANVGDKQAKTGGSKGGKKAKDAADDVAGVASEQKIEDTTV